MDLLAISITLINRNKIKKNSKSFAYKSNRSFYSENLQSQYFHYENVIKRKI